MAFSDEPDEDGRKRRRVRGRSDPSESPWPRQDQPLSWAMLPPEQGSEEPLEAEETPSPSTHATRPTPAPSEGAAEDWRSRYQYLLAEFDNYRRRVQRDTDAAVSSARGNVLLKVIGLHEGIEHALEALPSDAKALRDGLSLVLRNMDTLLRDEGVEPVASEGARFQPDLHEAVGQAPSGPRAPEGTVATVVQQGYRGRSGLLRPAKVLVASGPPPPPSKGEKGVA